MLKKLFTPFRYLQIEHQQLRRYDVGMPLILSLIGLALYMLSPVQLNLLGEGGLLASLKDILALMFAFFVASLAAVATFGSQNLDKILAGTPPTLSKQNQQGQLVKSALTRRQFLSYLFGYLSLISLLQYLVISGLRFFLPAIKIWLSGTSPLCWKALLIFIGGVFFWNMIMTTMLGLHYLTDRIHRD